jgi:hypothetical protein
MAELNPLAKPRTVQSAKLVDLALVSYIDPDGGEHTQLCVVGDNTVIMLDGRGLGYSNRPDSSGIAAAWLRDEVLKALNKAPSGG